MSSTKEATTQEEDRPIDDRTIECELESRDLDDKEKTMKHILRRNASPSIVINRNGSRFIAPIEIVRSEAGRAEIQRQRSQGGESVKRDQKNRSTSKKENSR